MTDKDLRRYAEQSSEAARRALFDEYCGYVYVICANKLKGCAGGEDIDECLNDTFAAVFRYLDTSSGHEGDLKGIIGTIARRTAISYFRRLSPDADRTVSIDAENIRELPSDMNVADEAERSAMSETVLDCIEALGKPDSSIIVYFYYYGKSTKEIASLTGLSSTAVQQRLSRARKKLKKLLSETGISEEGYL